MPVSRVPGERMARTIGDIYAEAELEILRDIARRIEKGLQPTVHQRAKLDMVDDLRAATARTLTFAERRALIEARKILDAAYDAGAHEALTDLYGSSFVQTRLTETAGIALSRILADLTKAFDGMGPLILRETIDAYQQIIGEIVPFVRLGTHTRRQATQAALDRFATHGITGFIDKAGRHWRIDTYAEMATRTGAGLAALQGGLDQLVINGHDLTIVSDAPRECPKCAPWERQVLSITGIHPRGTYWLPSAVDPHAMVEVFVAGTVDEAREAGLHHPNCRHSQNAYLPGATPTAATQQPEHSPELYQAAQRQRAMEREVRKWKRRAAIGNPNADPKVREWQKRIRDHLDEWPELKRLYYRETTPTGRKSRP